MSICTVCGGEIRHCATCGQRLAHVCAADPLSTHIITAHRCPAADVEGRDEDAFSTFCTQCGRPTLHCVTCGDPLPCACTTHHVRSSLLCPPCEAEDVGSQVLDS